MRLNKRFRACLGVAALTGAMLVGPAQAAFADPAECEKGIQSDVHLHSGELLHAILEGDCAISDYRSLRGEIKEDKPLQPDPVVLGGIDSGSQRHYAVELLDCGNGKATYYARVFWQGHVGDHMDGYHRTLDVC